MISRVYCSDFPWLPFPCWDFSLPVSLRLFELYFLQAYMMACVWNCYRYVTSRGSSEILLYVTTNDTTVSLLSLPVSYQDQRHNMVQDVWQKQIAQWHMLTGLQTYWKRKRHQQPFHVFFLSLSQSTWVIQFQITLCEPDFIIVCSLQPNQSFSQFSVGLANPAI